MTAVEQLIKEVEVISNSTGISRIEKIELYNKAIEQAKETEKKRLKDAYNAGIWDVGCRAPNFDEYYKRTFKSESDEK